MVKFYTMNYYNYYTISGYWFCFGITFIMFCYGIDFHKRIWSSNKLDFGYWVAYYHWYSIFRRPLDCPFFEKICFMFSFLRVVLVVANALRREHIAMGGNLDEQSVIQDEARARTGRVENQRNSSSRQHCHLSLHSDSYDWAWVKMSIQYIEVTLCNKMEVYKEICSL